MSANRLDGLIAEWAEDVVNRCHLSGYYGINVVEKILRDPGRSTKGSQHRVLWWPRNKRTAKISKLMHQIDVVSQICLIVAHGGLLKDDGNVFTKHDLAKSSSVNVRRFNGLVKNAKSKLLKKLVAYERGVA